jgi:hypothetical protein
MSECKIALTEKEREVLRDEIEWLRSFLRPWRWITSAGIPL